MGDLQGHSATELSESDFQTRYEKARLGDTDQAQSLQHALLNYGAPGWEIRAREVADRISLVV